MDHEITTPDNFNPATVYVSNSVYRVWAKALRHKNKQDQYALPDETGDVLVGKHLVKKVTERKRYSTEVGDFDDMPTGKYITSNLGIIWLEYKNRLTQNEKSIQTERRTTKYIAIIAIIIAGLSLIWQIIEYIMPSVAK